MIHVALAYTAATYTLDVLVRPARVATQARAAAAGRPVLNVGCGTAGSSLRALVFGPTAWGDTNCDIAAKRSCDGTGRKPCYCDALDLPFPDASFGAVIASHVVEHVSDPVRAVEELHRVADHVFIIVPKWWAPHTWLHPGHKWFIDGAGRHRPLW